MSKFVFYETGTGRITKVVECTDEDAPLNLEDNEKALKVPLDFEVSDGTHYVNPETQAIWYKEPLSGTREINLEPGEQTIIPLPETCLVEINGDIFDSFEVDDGTLELEFAAPGEYRVSFEMNHYVKQEVMIHVKEN